MQAVKKAGMGDWFNSCSTLALSVRTRILPKSSCELWTWTVGPWPIHDRITSWKRSERWCEGKRQKNKVLQATTEIYLLISSKLRGAQTHFYWPAAAGSCQTQRCGESAAVFQWPWPAETLESPPSSEGKSHLWGRNCHNVSTCCPGFSERGDRDNQHQNMTSQKYILDTDGDDVFPSLDMFIPAKKMFTLCSCVCRCGQHKYRVECKDMPNLVEDAIACRDGAGVSETDVLFVGVI